MPFCPICKGNHDPSLPCGDRTAQFLNEAGIKRQPTMSPSQFRETVRKADRFVLLLFLLLAGLIAAVVVVAYLWR